MIVARVAVATPGITCVHVRMSARSAGVGLMGGRTSHIRRGSPVMARVMLMRFACIGGIGLIGDVQDLSMSHFVLAMRRSTTRN
jgi:hypothetical protein